jgi:two-component system sensor histidine kinase TctE
MPFSFPSQSREQRSLFGEILDWMLAPLLMVWPMSVILTGLVAQSIANGPYDRDLGEIARVISKQVVVQAAADGTPKARLVLTPLASDMLRNDEVDTISYQVLGLRGELIAGDRMLALPPEDEPTPKSGMVRWRDERLHNEPVRVAYLRAELTPDGETVLVQVAETLEKRSRLATEIIKGVILPQFLILPLAVLLVWLALSRGIAPLAELRERIRRRQSHDLSAIDESLAPEEVAPLVRSINELLARLDHSIGTQKQFLADAAHQLKTPLAGLRTQAELAQREIDAGLSDMNSLRRSLGQIARGSQSAAHMVNQLLAMARAEDQEHAVQRQRMNLARLAADTVRDFVPRALAKRIDLGYEGPAEDGSGRTMVLGHPVLLRELIRNLVDNALLYTPNGGTVTVRVVGDPFGQVVVLQVEDSGPGIPAAEREKVFLPFYRVLGTETDGSGLGLAIVRQIAREHGAELELTETDPRPRPAAGTAAGAGPGARFTLRFSAAPQEPRAAA